MTEHLTFKNEFYVFDEEDEQAGKIWWLSSYPRSGNTWTRAFLYSYHNNGRPVVLDEIANVVGGDRDMAFFQNVCGLDVKLLPKEFTDMIRPAALLNLVQVKARPGMRLILKTHSVASDQKTPPLITNGAIHLIRDPRSIAPSMADQIGISIDDAITAMVTPGLEYGETIPHVVHDWVTHIRSWQNAPFKGLHIRYEDMKKDCRGPFKAMLEFMGWPFDQGVFDRAVSECSLSKLKALEGKTRFREKGMPGNEYDFFGGKHPTLTPDQEARILDHCGELMQELGYTGPQQNTKGSERLRGN